MKGDFYKNHETDQVWWVSDPENHFGEFRISFDKKTVINLFRDYPWKLTAQQKETFDRENPEWAEFFSDRG